jgi:hypothetical protein
LLHFVTKLREEFDSYEAKAKSEAAVTEYSDFAKRVKQRSSKIRFNDGQATDTILSGIQRFKISVFFPVLDILAHHLKIRKAVYETVLARFEVFTNLKNLSFSEIEEKGNVLAAFYDNDINRTAFILELKQFQGYIHKQLPLKEMYDVIVKDNQTLNFANIEIALRIYLVLMVANCTGERSFSRLKATKSPTRNSIGQEKMNHLSVMCMNPDILEKIDFSTIVAEFAEMKTRRK